MKVLNPRSALLSDYEVLSLLREMEEEQQRASAGESSASGAGGAHTQQKRIEEGMRRLPENLRTIQYETLATLTQPYRACVYQSPSQIEALHAALRRNGFIGGRRPLHTERRRQQRNSRLTDQAADDEDEEMAAGEVVSTPSKRKAANGRTSRSKRSKRTPSPPVADDSTAEGALDAVQSSSPYPPRGPDEILPDRSLTKSERLQLINHAPRSIVELHVLVEELTVRFTQEQIEELLAIVRTCLEMPPVEDDIAVEHGQSYQEEAGMQQGEEAEAEAEADMDEASNGLFIGGADESEMYADEGYGEGQEDEDDDDALLNEGYGGNGAGVEAGDGTGGDD